MKTCVTDHLAEWYENAVWISIVSDSRNVSMKRNPVDRSDYCSVIQGSFDVHYPHIFPFTHPCHTSVVINKIALHTHMHQNTFIGIKKKPTDKSMQLPFRTSFQICDHVLLTCLSLRKCKHWRTKHNKDWHSLKSANSPNDPIENQSYTDLPRAPSSFQYCLHAIIRDLCIYWAKLTCLLASVIAWRLNMVMLDCNEWECL